MVKVLKTLAMQMEANKNQFHFRYDYKVFYKETTTVFQYDPNNFLFSIKTGCQFGKPNYQQKDWSIIIYDAIREQLHDLIRQMKRELPQSQFEAAFAFYYFLKSKWTIKINGGAERWMKSRFLPPAPECHLPSLPPQ